MYIGWGYVGFWETELYDKDHLLIDSRLWTTKKKAQKYMEYFEELKKVFPEDFNDCSIVMGGKNVFFWGVNSNTKFLMKDLENEKAKKEKDNEHV